MSHIKRKGLLFIVSGCSFDVDALISPLFRPEPIKSVCLCVSPILAALPWFKEVQNT